MLFRSIQQHYSKKRKEVDVDILYRRLNATAHKRMEEVEWKRGSLNTSRATLLAHSSCLSKISEEITFKRNLEIEKEQRRTEREQRREEKERERKETEAKEEERRARRMADPSYQAWKERLRCQRLRQKRRIAQRVS